MKLTGKYIDDIFVIDSGAGDGSTALFNLTEAPHSANQIDVYLNGILTTEYSVNVVAQTITFTGAPALAQDIDIKYIKK